jgi:tRNA pseudouridine55 synthase
MLSDGFILVDKHLGISSFDVIRKIKKNSSQKKIGHAGTLDPLASGLLIVLFGKGTKTAQYFNQLNKIYEFEITLGVQTSTGDREGSIIKKASVFKSYSVPEINNCLSSFVGKHFQVPPVYSALKHKGKPYYYYARKNEPIEIESREIEIYSIKLISQVDYKVVIQVCCGSGTYIRTLAEDISIALGTVGHASAIRRLSIGNFEAKNGISVTDDLLVDISKSMIPVSEVFKDYPTIRLELDKAIRFAQGQKIIEHGSDYKEDKLIVINSIDDSFIGLGRIINDGSLKPIKIFK